jgi:hypothetical protein
MSIEAILDAVPRLSSGDRDRLREALNKADESEFPLTAEQQADLRERLTEPDDTETVSREEFIAKFLPTQKSRH